MLRVRLLDWLLLLSCLALVVAGPAMAVQELSELHEAQALSELTGRASDLDLAFRQPWRIAMLGLVVWTGAIGTAVAVRVATKPRVRAVSKRLMTLLLAGMTLLDLAFVLDGRVLAEAPHMVRAATVVWLYPAAALLMAGSAVRLAELDAFFGAPAEARVGAGAPPTPAQDAVEADAEA